MQATLPHVVNMTWCIYISNYIYRHLFDHVNYRRNKIDVVSNYKWMAKYILNFYH